MHATVAAPAATMTTEDTPACGARFGLPWALCRVSGYLRCRRAARRLPSGRSATSSGPERPQSLAGGCACGSLRRARAALTRRSRMRRRRAIGLPCPVAGHVSGTAPSCGSGMSRRSTSKSWNASTQASPAGQSCSIGTTGPSNAPLTTARRRSEWWRRAQFGPREVETMGTRERSRWLHLRPAGGTNGLPSSRRTRCRCP
mmetsp:Transcript_13317/g.41968  ORF Transcript_13317/g.41968 Transcript_13317/m.41968 type:complete len:201 (-) Transcript_13317:176-778(-)